MVQKKCVAAMAGKGFHVLRLMLDLFWFLWQHEEVTFWCFNCTNTLSGFPGENHGFQGVFMDILWFYVGS